MNRLSPHFTLDEFTKSQTAIRNQISNLPTRTHEAAMVLLCEHVLEPIRAHFGPVKISSGYRSLALNRAIGGAISSQHSLGEAVDIEVTGVSNGDLAQWIAQNVPFDQLILEFHTRGEPNSGWVHVSYREGRLRGQCLTTSNGKTYQSGLIA